MRSKKPEVDRGSELEKRAIEPDLPFELAMEQAEGIVGELEEGALGLSDSLKKYERGIALLAKCFQMLEEAELKVAQFTGIDAAGRPQTVEFDAVSEQALEQKARARSQRRSATSPDKPSQGARRQDAGQDAGGPQENHPDEESVDESGSLF